MIWVLAYSLLGGRICKKIFYEKEIDLFHRLKELVSLTVDESIDYKMEEHGIRALGTLAIKGEYLSDEKKNF